MKKVEHSAVAHEAESHGEPWSQILEVLRRDAGEALPRNVRLTLVVRLELLYPVIPLDSREAQGDAVVLVLQRTHFDVPYFLQHE